MAKPTHSHIVRNKKCDKEACIIHVFLHLNKQNFPNKDWTTPWQTIWMYSRYFQLTCYEVLAVILAFGWNRTCSIFIPTSQWGLQNLPRRMIAFYPKLVGKLVGSFNPSEKNLLVKLDHETPRVRDEHIKYLSCHHLVNIYTSPMWISYLV